jgi:hypothetical protein
MSNEMQRWTESFAKEQALKTNLDMAEYAIIVQAMTIAQMDIDHWTVHRLRELVQNRKDAIAAHLAQMQITTQAMREAREAFPVDQQEVLDA